MVNFHFHCCEHACAVLDGVLDGVLEGAVLHRGADLDVHQLKSIHASPASAGSVLSCGLELLSRNFACITSQKTTTDLPVSGRSVLTMLLNNHKMHAPRLYNGLQRQLAHNSLLTHDAFMLQTISQSKICTAPSE